MDLNSVADCCPPPLSQAAGGHRTSPMQDWMEVREEMVQEDLA